MDFEDIENLSEEQILEAYNNVIEKDLDYLAGSYSYYPTPTYGSVCDPCNSLHYTRCCFPNDPKASCYYIPCK